MLKPVCRARDTGIACSLLLGLPWILLMDYPVITVLFMASWNFIHALFMFFLL